MRRGAKVSAIAGVTGLVCALAIAVAPASVPPAAAAVGDCPDGTLPGPGSSNPVWTDQNVAVYAGQDFTAEADSAELEGLLVVAGDATFSTPGRFNVGWVGVGSAAAPYPGSVMLAVGGDVTVDLGTVLDVGANAFDENGDLLGGDVQVGGITIPDYVTNGLRYELNNGTLTQGMGAAAIADWATFGDDISAESAAFAALTPTGTVAPAGPFLDFTGDGTSNPQVFTVTAAVLAANPAINFVGLADDVPVIINVTGAGPVTWAPNWFSEDGVRADDLSSPLFGMVAQRTMWNFTESTSVHIDGSSQVLGSILVPGANPDTAQPTVRITASTNGRVYTNGSIVMDGVGNEHHNYPWLSEPFECIPIDALDETGSLSITKEVSPEDAALLPDGATFHGTVVCPLEGGGELVVEWHVAPGETVEVSGLPVAATCTVDESLGLLGRAYIPLEGLPDVARLFEWQDPVWSVNGVETAPPVAVVVPAPDDAVQVTITVLNAIAYGAFTIGKVVEAGAGTAPDVAFTGDWSCELPAGTVVASGTWTASAAGAAGPFEAPVGAECAVTEVQPTDPANGTWGEPVVDPASVEISAESLTTPLEITVTNTFEETGAFVITKAVEGAGAPPTVFAGTWTCSAGEAEVASGTWSLSAGETSDAFEAPVGAQCVIEEDAPGAVDGGLWQIPVIEPELVTIPSGSLAEPFVITVTNTFVAEDQLGAFQVVKVVENLGGVSFEGGFEGSYECVTPDLARAILTGTWSVEGAGGASAIIDAPIGSVCTVTEIQPDDPTGGEWQTPVVSPASVTIDEGSADQPLEFTVTNRLTATGDGELSETGGSPALWPVPLAAAAIVAGAILLGARRRAARMPSR
jgi:choice-of-anchor A domain-containing protein